MKRIVYIFVMVFLVSVLLAGCASTAPPPTSPSSQPPPAKPAPTPSADAPTTSPPAKPPANWPASISIADTFTGTGGHATLVGVAQVLTKNIGIKTVCEPGNTGNKNVMILRNKDAELAQIFSDHTYDAARGLGEYKQYGKMDIRLLWMASLPTPFTFLTGANMGITSVTDLKGKKVMMLFSTNTTFTKMADTLLESVGMTRNDVTALPFSNQSEALPELRGNRISAFIQAHPAKGLASWLQEANLISPVSLFTAPEDKIDAVIAKYPYLRKYTMDGKTYGGITGNKDLTTISVPEGIFCRSDLPDDLAYTIMKTIFTNTEEINKFHAQAVQYTASPLAFLPVVPVHAGAVQFYKEKGLWTDKLEALQKQNLAEVGAPK